MDTFTFFTGTGFFEHLTSNHTESRGQLRSPFYKWQIFPRQEYFNGENILQKKRTQKTSQRE